MICLTTLSWPPICSPAVSSLPRLPLACLEAPEVIFRRSEHFWQDTPLARMLKLVRGASYIVRLHDAVALRNVSGVVALLWVAGRLLPEPNRLDTGEFGRSMAARTVKSCGGRSMTISGGKKLWLLKSN